MKQRTSTLPHISAPLLKWFTWYAKRHIRRHFHAFRVAQPRRSSHIEGRPCVVYVNHASWWDPLVCLALKDELFPERSAYAPIDAAMLQRYAVFKRLGFFGVEQKSSRGAVNFLRTVDTILRAPDSLLALTPQGRFADVRERPVQFAGGLGHLAARIDRAVFIPIAIEYVFWEERFPEILVRVGETTEVRPEHKFIHNARYWTSLFEQKLSETQDALAIQAQRRNVSEFETLLSGRAGTAVIYDLWREFNAAWRGRQFRKEHGTI